MSLIQTQFLNDDYFKKYCLRVFSHLNPNSTFLSIKNYKNNFGEIADFSVVFHIDYLNALRRSFKIINELKLENSCSEGQQFDLDTLKRVRDEVLKSFTMSLANKEHPNYTCAGVYEEIFDSNGKTLSGVRLHAEQNIVHINALKFRKNIIRKGIYPKRNSFKETYARRYLIKQTPLINWVQFKLTPGRFDQLTVQKMRLVGKE